MSMHLYIVRWTEWSAAEHHFMLIWAHSIPELFDVIDTETDPSDMEFKPIDQPVMVKARMRKCDEDEGEASWVCDDAAKLHQMDLTLEDALEDSDGWTRFHPSVLETVYPGITPEIAALMGLTHPGQKNDGS